MSAPNGSFDRLQVSLAPLRRQLNPVRQPAALIVHEFQGIFRAVPADMPGQDQLGIGVQGRPCPTRIFPTGRGNAG
jgi:hypothetical protein